MPNFTDENRNPEEAENLAENGAAANNAGVAQQRPSLYAAQRARDIAESQTLDELFARSIVDVEQLTDEEKESLKFYDEQVADAATTFLKQRNTKLSTQEERFWKNVKDPAEIARRRKLTAELKEDIYEDTLIAVGEDKRFTLGKAISTYSQATPEVLDRAAEIIREEQASYKSTSVWGRFFSYLNPFANPYREHRNQIAAMKRQVADKVKCTAGDLEKFLDGKITELPYKNDKVAGAKFFDDIAAKREEANRARADERTKELLKMLGKEHGTEEELERLSEKQAAREANDPREEITGEQGKTLENEVCPEKNVTGAPENVEPQNTTEADREPAPGGHER